MRDSNTNFEQLQKTFLELNELRFILKKTHSFFEEVRDFDDCKSRLYRMQRKYSLRVLVVTYGPYF